MPSTEKTRQAKTYVPNELEQDQIAKFIKQMEQQFQQKTRTTLTSSDGEVVELPEKLFDVLRQVAEALAVGKGVSVIPQDMKLTTQGAADFLGVSRPTLIKLLESGVIPFEKVGRHRRVTLRDVLEYRNKSRVERRTTLRQMARAGQESGMLDLVESEMPDRE
jgi:excisionase family DNA binding protein